MLKKNGSQGLSDILQTPCVNRVLSHRSLSRHLTSITLLLFYGLPACSPDNSTQGNAKTDGAPPMIERLEQFTQQAIRQGDRSVGMDVRVMQQRQVVEATGSFPKNQVARMTLGYELLRAGKTEEAIIEFKEVQSRFNQKNVQNEITIYESVMATAYLREAEELNCMAQHNADSCLLPIRGGGLHTVTSSSRKAIKHLMASLEQNPDNLADRWLLNIAHMTLGEYPNKPAAPFLIPPAVFASDYDIGRFKNVAHDVGLGIRGLAGGSVMDDLDNDGYLDLVASDWGIGKQMRYLKNRGDGTFVDRTKEAGLLGQVGGLNMNHVDYDNDGDADVLVLRGAWQGAEGRLPNSLLRNNGDGTFVDVTDAAGLLSFHPTQAAVWGDFDNDGWVDLFIGNESGRQSTNACQLYKNNKDGTFSNVAAQLGVANVGFVKGAAWGDYDNDGWLDLYLSRLGGPNILYQNQEGPSGTRTFRDVTDTAGVTEPQLSFPTWFWDYDNDGWLDLFAGSFPGFSGDTLNDIAAGYLDKPFEAPYPRIYHNNGDGTFTDVTKEAGLIKPMLIMGANFGDLDNDGFLDFYLGTGEPNLHSLVPNRMYRNAGNGAFQNVTASGGFGHLQKGHGISFGDIDNDGDQDIHAVMGGAYQGDLAYNALFLNPGHGNHWITLRLEGVTSNRSGVGVRIEVTTKDSKGDRRRVTSTVGTGGSFGSSSLQQEIGLGTAESIESLTIWWPTSGHRQTFRDVAINNFFVIREDTDQLIPVAQRTADLTR